MNENLRNDLWEFFPDLIFFDHPVNDTSIVGLALLNDDGPSWCIVYDEGLVLNDLVKEFDDEIDAIEWYNFNTAGSYCGSATPLFIHDNEDNDFPASRIGSEITQYFSLNDVKNFEHALSLVEDQSSFLFVKLNQLDEIKNLV
jgi:hypothetical protein